MGGEARWCLSPVLTIDYSCSCIGDDASNSCSCNGHVKEASGLEHQAWVRLSPGSRKDLFLESEDENNSAGEPLRTVHRHHTHPRRKYALGGNRKIQTRQYHLQKRSLLLVGIGPEVVA